jgi:hypothetical protein
MRADGDFCAKIKATALVHKQKTDAESKIVKELIFANDLKNVGIK